MSEEQRRNWKSDWFGSGGFSWWHGAAPAMLYFSIIVAVFLSIFLMPLFFKVREAARFNNTKADMTRYAADLQEYRKAKDHWPDESDWYVHLHSLKPGLAKRIPLDPWGQKIRYRISSDKGVAILESAGWDGRFGRRDDVRALVFPETLVVRQLWYRR